MDAVPDLKKTKPVKFADNGKFLQELKRLSPKKEVEASAAVSLSLFQPGVGSIVPVAGQPCL